MATIVESRVDALDDNPVAEQSELFLASRRFTPEEYMRMAQAGILDDDERLELLEGMIIKMMVRKPAHDECILNVDEAFRPICPKDFHLRFQMAVALQDSHPEPDCAVIRGARKRGANRFPGLNEIELVIEVSDSTLRRDRGIKARIYARAGIPTYWILNLEERQLEVFTEPTGAVDKPVYQKCTIHKSDAKVALALGGQSLGEIAVADLLP